MLRKFLASLLVLLGLSVVSFAITGEEIIKRSDLWRAPEGSFEAKIKIVSFKDDEKVEEIELKSYIRDIDSVMVEFTGPLSWKGRKMLMLKNDMWMIFPNTSKPIRITPAQRLMGEVANGDIAKLNLAGDYNATLKGEDKVKGEECYFVELVAKSTEGMTYYKINYWVRKEDFRPIKAEFYSLSGRKLKEAYYSDPKEMGGGMRIGKVTLYDAINTSKYSMMYYLDMRPREIPASYYNLNYLIKK